MGFTMTDGATSDGADTDVIIRGGLWVADGIEALKYIVLLLYDLKRYFIWSYVFTEQSLYRSN